MAKAKAISGFDGETVAAKVPTAEMVIGTYQGHVNKKLVEKIAAEWDESAAGAIILNMREDETYAILDGQHRFLAAKKRGIKDLNALVFIGKTEEEEARLFVQLNTKHNVLPFDRFCANLQSGQSREVAVNNIVTGIGLTIKNDPTNSKAVRSVATLLKLFDDYGAAHLMKTMQVLHESFDAYNDAMAWSDSSMRGMAALLYRYPDVNMTRLIAQLQKHSPRTLQGRAMLKMGPGRGWIGWGEVFTEIYNNGLRGDSKLPMSRWEKAVYTPKGREERKLRGKKDTEHLKPYQFKPGVRQSEQLSRAAKATK
jgi:hypothetical protein